MGPLLLGHRKRQVSKAASSPSRAAQGPGQWGWGPGGSPIHYQRQCHLHPGVVSGTWGPYTSLPGPRGQRSRLRRAPEKTRAGCGEETKSPTWHQNRTSSKKQSLDLYSSCSWPAHDRGPSPTSWPSKKLGNAGVWPPSGQCMELRKVSLHDTGERQG